MATYAKIFSKVYSVYFENTDNKIEQKDRPLYCTVLAKDVESALRKVKHFYPNERVNSVFSEKRYGGQSLDEEILL